MSTICPSNYVAVLLLAIGAIVGQVPTPRPAQAQVAIAEATATPEATATYFLRSVRAIRWNTTAQLLHEETLDRFHYVVTMIADTDSTGALLEFLVGTDAAGYARLTHAEVFDRAVGSMIEDMPGLMHAIFDHDDEVLGAVEESPDTAHAVYRTTPRISGGVSEVQVVQLRRTPEGWRVLWSEELEVLDAALRGLPRMRAGPRVD